MVEIFSFGIIDPDDECIGFSGSYMTLVICFSINNSPGRSGLANCQKKLRSQNYEKKNILYHYLQLYGIGISKKFLLKLRNYVQWRKDFLFIVFRWKYALKTAFGSYDCLLANI